MIRPLAPTDAPAVVELVHTGQPIPWPVTVEGFLRWFEIQPERARAAAWVAAEHGNVVGFARARLGWWTTTAGAADLWLIVAPEHRRRGHGAALFAAADEHLRVAGARSLLSFTESAEGRRFLEGRGFAVRRSERISAIAPAAADLSVLPGLEGARAAEGFRLVPLASVADRARELHALDAAITADVPDAFGHDDVRYEEWLRECLGHPQLTYEGSFVVLAGERPVSLAFIETDPPARLAANAMTGTLPEFRGRGLARLVKLATIRWAAENGIDEILTTNGDENAAVLALNESLGYRTVGIQWHLVRE